MIGVRFFSMARSSFPSMHLFSNVAARSTGVTTTTTPMYLMNATDALEASLESMRLMEEPICMQLLNRNARRPKKANHGKRPCSHFRRRQKRLGKKK